MEELSAAEAQRLIDSAPDPVEQATVRVAGLVWMIWGLAFSGGVLAAETLNPGHDTINSFAEALMWFVAGTLVPVAVASLAAARIYAAHRVLPANQSALRLAAAAVGAVLGAWLLMWAIGFPFLFASQFGLEIGFSMRGAPGGLFTVALWAVWFARSPWSRAAGSPRFGYALAAVLILASIPLGIIARATERSAELSTVAAAFIIMAGFGFLGAKLYARG